MIFWEPLEFAITGLVLVGTIGILVALFVPKDWLKRLRLVIKHG